MRRASRDRDDFGTCCGERLTQPAAVLRLDQETGVREEVAKCLAAAQWSGATGRRDDRVLRIDPASLEIAEVVRVGGNVPSVAFAFGSVWAADNAGRVVRITPPE